MTNYLQQQSFVRKIIYLGVIVGLFAGARVWQLFVVETQAANLGIREQDRGQVQWNESALSLMLFSMRGFVVMYLSLEVNEYQERNQLSELDMTVTTLTMLQAHHKEPWLYHSWNLAYNVAGQCDRLEDKYYFINRGIKVLAKGEQRLQNQPDLRFNMGHYYQHKICECDERNVMRSLFQLSCIDPKERDPHRFRKQDRDGRWMVDMHEFREFCLKHPVLIRRLREPPMRQRRPDDVFVCHEPEDVIAFLEENVKIPCFKDDEKFPILPPARTPPPPQRLYDASEFTAESLLDDNFDAYMAARAWYCYAQEPLPMPGVKSWSDYVASDGKDDSMLPGHSLPVEDRRVQRPAKIMAQVIFRTYPALCQGWLADRLEEEGWFDDSDVLPTHYNAAQLLASTGPPPTRLLWCADTSWTRCHGWKITGWFQEERREDHPLVVLGPRYGIGKSWERAYERWKEIGQVNGLLIPKDDLAKMEPKADAFRQRPESERAVQEGEEYKADKYLREYETYKRLTNFTHHTLHAKMESEKEAVTAHQHFYEARRLLKVDARPEAAVREYEKPGAMPAWKILWKKYLREYPELATDDATQDFAAELQYDYLKLLQDTLERANVPRQLFTIDCLFQAMVGPPAQPAWVSMARLGSHGRSLLGLNIRGPFDEDDDNGRPLIPQAVRNNTRFRKGELGTPTPPRAGGDKTSPGRSTK